MPDVRLRRREFHESLRYLADQLLSGGNVEGVAFALHMLADEIDPAHLQSMPPNLQREIISNLSGGTRIDGRDDAHGDR